MAGVGEGEAMSGFTDQVRNSAALSNLRESSGMLRELVSVEWEVEETSDLITRLTVVVENLLGRLTIADRNLVPGSILAPLESQTQKIREAMQSLSSSAPSVQINIPKVNDWADDILDTASALPVLPIRTTNQVLEKASEQFDREAISAKASISAEVKTLRTGMAEFHQDIQQATTDFNDRVAELKELIDQRTAEARNTTNSLAARINHATERLERDVTNIQGSFRDSQSEQSALFAESQESRDREFHERLDPTLVDIESSQDQAKRMLEEVAGASSAEHYSKLRDAQKKNADLWRWIGVGGLFILVVIAGFIFFDTRSANTDFSTVWLVARSSLLFSLGIFAGYAFRQSGQHRTREDAIARVANELMLLWPFMARLPDDDRELLLREITPLYFKGGLSGGDTAEQVNTIERVRTAFAQRGRKTPDG